MTYKKYALAIVTGFVLSVMFFPYQGNAQDKKLTFEDIMKWEDISDEAISADGNWVTYSVWPDRGDGEARIKSVDGNTTYTIERGDNPEITRNGSWVAAYVEPPLAEQLKSNGNGPRRGLVLLNTGTGDMHSIDSVRSFEFSNDGRWVAIHKYQSKEIADTKSANDRVGSELLVRNLDTGTQTGIPFVHETAFDSTSSYLALSVVDTSGTENGLYYLDLSSDNPGKNAVEALENGYFTNLAWEDESERLAYTRAQFNGEGEPGDATLRVWNAGEGEVATLVGPSDPAEGWALRSNNNLDWTHDGNRLFFGLMPRDMVEIDQKEEQPDSAAEIDIYDREQVLEEKGVDVWHWDDPRIKTYEKETWNRRKNRTYRAVYHLDRGEWVQLADREMPEVDFTHNPDFALGSSDVPYLKEMTWDGFFSDYYVVDLDSGERRRVVKKSRFGAGLSPGGSFVVYYDNKSWHLYDIREDVYRNLTADLDVPFYNEDHDYPYPAPGYGVAGWMEGDQSVLIYDKFDIWKFPLSGGDPVNLTEDGREREVSYRIERMDYRRQAFENNEEVLLEAYYDKKKNNGFYTLRLDRPGTERRLEDKKRFNFQARAEEGEAILYTRESYIEYPNLWLSSDGTDFEEVRQVSNLHPDLKDTYNWGTPELIEWTSLDGKELQGVVIKPDNYEEGKKYPLMLYFYRLFSERMYQFNNITNDDRPVLPQYVSDGYIVFLPDVRFDVGTPGFSSTKSLVPGVQKLIEMGLVDKDKLGLHGHSWGGYQTAHVVTQTDIFDAAIAGAPVSNMTSAYSGIRWGSGLARQFQYEQTQSRIGGSLWEYPERYIENSPVFYADRIETPLLMMFGDEDTAVPWYQGIELYLAMRRLEKDAIFLQYRGEPHHLREYSNKLDYAIKMKEYFDHYLKGEPAPEWITDGIPFIGK